MGCSGSKPSVSPPKEAKICQDDQRLPTLMIASTAPQKGTTLHVSLVSDDVTQDLADELLSDIKIAPTDSSQDADLICQPCDRPARTSSQKTPAAPALRPRNALKLAEFCRTKSRSKPGFVLPLPLKKGLCTQPRSADEVGVGVHEVQGPGTIDKNAHEKVVLVVGQTGSGKSTHIEGIVNNYLEVQYEDDFRFKLIADDTICAAAKGDQSQSQTNWITAYRIPRFEGAEAPYALTIIDTPGFGDSRGYQQDQRTVTAMRQLFSGDLAKCQRCRSLGDSSTVDQQKCRDCKARLKNIPIHVNSIVFVATASIVRLTPSQKYVFDSVLAMFGNDVKESFSVHFTFADAKRPPGLDAIKAAEIPHNKWYKFSNSALFLNPQGDADEGDDDDSDGLGKVYFKMGRKQHCDYAKELRDQLPKSFALSAEVLTTRQTMEARLDCLQPLILQGLHALEDLRKQADFIQKYSAEIDMNANFVVTSKKIDIKKNKVPDGKHTTLCLKCNFTCHRICAYPCPPNMHGLSENPKKDCCMMSGDNCTACPKRCHYAEHVDSEWILDPVESDVSETSEEMKARFIQSTGKKADSETMLQVAVDKYNSSQDRITKNIDDMRVCKMKLAEIALRPFTMDAVEHFDILIRSEQAEKKPGFPERIRQLQELKDRLQNKDKVLKGQSPMDEILAKYRQDKDSNIAKYLHKLEQAKMTDEAAIQQKAKEELKKSKPSALPKIPAQSQQETCKTCSGSGQRMMGVMTCSACGGTGATR